jgi:hypothetical protein
MTYPQSPGGLALHGSPAPAAQSFAPRNPAFAPWKGTTPVRYVPNNFFAPPGGGPAED